MIRTIRRIGSRLLGSLSTRRLDNDVAEEFESHIQMLAEDSIRSGVAPDEAYRRARLQFGSVGSATESYRDQAGLPLLDALGQDVRYACRWLRKNPGFAAVAVLSLGIGIGANTAIFSLMNSILLQPLRYKEPDRLFTAGELLPHLFGQSPMPVNPMHPREWVRDCPSVESAVVMRSSRAALATGGEPTSIPGTFVQHDVFGFFGVEPILGRTFLPAEEQAGNDSVVILSESLWRSRFNADPLLLGRTIVLDGRNHEVVGVMPSWFRLRFGTGAANVVPEIFRPLVLDQREQGRWMGNFNYTAVVRLRRGATRDQAIAEMNVVQGRFPALSGSKVELRAALTPAHESVTGRARSGLWMLAAAVASVLLIVCINLANLLLSRMASRSREAAIRTALGASRVRQFRMLLTESLLIAMMGGVVGVVLANWSLQALLTTTTLDIPRLDEVRLDLTVLAFAVGLTLVTGFIFGALPAWRLTRNDPQQALRAQSHQVTEGRGGLRIREAIISVEVGLSAALLIIAGLLGTSFTRLIHVDKGFDVDRVLTADLSLAGSGYAEPANRARFFERVLARLSAIPGIEASGFITALPTRGETFLDPIYLEAEGSRRHPVNNRYASPEYFRTMNIAVRQGRTFDDIDRARSVAVLSEKAAKLLWPGEANPIGRRFIGEDNLPKTLVGIVADVRAVLHSDPPPTAYYPWWQRVPNGVALVVRTSGDPQSAAGAVRAALRNEDPQMPIRTVATLQQEVGRSVAVRKLQLTVVALFAGAALLVTCLGIYGVLNYSVARRRSEIGIRIALGARPSRLLGLVIGQGMLPVVIGLAAGVAFALLFSQAIRGLLFGVQPADPLTITGVSLALLFVGALACFIPAWRAAGTNPATVLRLE